MARLPDDALVVRGGQNLPENLPMAIPKVYADFQNLDDYNRLRLTCAGTQQDLERQGIQLQEGLVLTLSMDDADDQRRPDELRAEGVVTYNGTEHCWVAPSIGPRSAMPLRRVSIALRTIHGFCRE
jgi:hypothetical protein